MVGNYILRAILIPVIPIALLSLPLTVAAVNGRLQDIKIGFVFYISLSCALLATAPAAIAHFPVISGLPMLITVAILGSIPIMSVSACCRSNKARMALLAYVIAIVIAPHDFGRAIWNTLRNTGDSEKRRLLVFVVDALRIDEARNIAGKTHNVYWGY